MKEKRVYFRQSVVALAFMLVMLFAFGVTVSAATPTGLRQTSDSETSVKVEFTGVAGARYYGYQLATDPGFTNVLDSGYMSSSWNYAYINNLGTGASYYVRIGWGTDSKNCYANFSEPIEVVTTPAKVTNVKFIGANDNAVALAWDMIPGATQYRAEYNSLSYTSATNSIWVPYDPSGYSIYVRAQRVSATGYVAEGGYAYVSNVSALTSKISKDNFGLRNAWTGLNSFQIAANYYGHGMDVEVYDVKTGKKKFSGTANNTTYGYVEFNKFKKSTMYKYRVRAYIITTDGQKIPGKSWSAYRYLVNPKETKYTQSGKKIKLNWSKLTGVSKIKIQVSTKEKSGYKTVATLKGTKTSYTITKYNKKALKKGKKYYVRIIYQAKSGKKNYDSDIYSQTSEIKVR
ncbi:MAG: hypothetical protein K2G89_00780 [Lachnospiraceae bacterium]|nr:hypothetical protein [Lachnospiraceae bacterium]